MKDLKKIVSAQLEDVTDVILTSTYCMSFWGEPELPDCLRAEVEAETED